MLASDQEGTTPAMFFELQYVNDLLVSVTAPNGLETINDSSFYGHMLVLPTGQILFTDFSTDVEIYTANDQSYDTVSAPAITAINGTACTGTFISYLCALTVHSSSPNAITGYRFNGMSQGSAYGDDYQSATNYPLVRLTPYQGFTIYCPSCPPPPPPKVYYCRTHDHSWMGVATQNLPVSTTFDCPGVPNGLYGLQVVANGVPSFSNLVSVGP